MLTAVRAAAPGLPVGVTTGAWAEPDPDARVALIEAWTVLPDFASVNWHEAGAERVAAALLDRGVGVEAGLWHADAVQEWLRSPACADAACACSSSSPTGTGRRDAAELLGLLGTDALTAARAAGTPILLHGEDRSAVAGAGDRGAPRARRRGSGRRTRWPAPRWFARHPIMQATRPRRPRSADRSGGWTIDGCVPGCTTWSSTAPIRGALAEFYARCWTSPSPTTARTSSSSPRATGPPASAFQRATGHRPPTWPSPETPQQMHLDVMVEDPAAAAHDVLRLGATHLDGDVYADPAGHPFCLIRRPHWADGAS